MTELHFLQIAVIVLLVTTWLFARSSIRRWWANVLSGLEHVTDDGGPKKRK